MILKEQPCSRRGPVCLAARLSQMARRESVNTLIWRGFCSTDDWQLQPNMSWCTDLICILFFFSNQFINLILFIQVIEIENSFPKAAPKLQPTYKDTKTARLHTKPLITDVMTHKKVLNTREIFQLIVANKFCCYTMKLVHFSKDLE